MKLTDFLPGFRLVKDTDGPMIKYASRDTQAAEQDEVLEEHQCIQPQNKEPVTEFPDQRSPISQHPNIEHMIEARSDLNILHADEVSADSDPDDEDRRWDSALVPKCFHYLKPKYRPLLTEDIKTISLPHRPQPIRPPFYSDKDHKWNLKCQVGVMYDNLTPRRPQERTDENDDMPKRRRISRKEFDNVEGNPRVDAFLRVSLPDFYGGNWDKYSFSDELGHGAQLRKIKLFATENDQGQSAIKAGTHASKKGSKKGAKDSKQEFRDLAYKIASEYWQSYTQRLEEWTPLFIDWWQEDRAWEVKVYRLLAQRTETRWEGGVVKTMPQDLTIEELCESEKVYVPQYVSAVIGPADVLKLENEIKAASWYQAQ